MSIWQKTNAGLVQVGGAGSTGSSGGTTSAVQAWQFRPEDYGAIGDNTTDDTLAIRATVNAAVAYAQAHHFYAEVIFAPVTYLVNGNPVVGGSTFGNSIIPLPYIADSGQKVVLALIGARGASTLPHWEQTSAQRSGTVLRTTRSDFVNDATWGTPSIIGGPTTAQGTGTFSNINPVIDGIALVAPFNPKIQGFDLGYCAMAEVISAGVCADAAPAGTPSLTSTHPTSDMSMALRMPRNQNNDKSYIVDFAVEGFYYGLAPAEHMTALRVELINTTVGLWVPGQYGFNHGWNIVNLSAELCDTVIQVGSGDGSSGGQAIVINQLGCETTGTWVVDDITNVLHGYIGWANYATHTPLVRGGANVKIEDLNVIRGAKIAPAVPTSTTALVNPFWRDCAVTISGGTVTGIAVDGTSLGVTSGTVIVPTGKTIALTYSAAPSWKWIVL